MDYMSAQQWEFLSFFKVEPKTLDDTSWPYNDFLYEVERGDLRLSCAIEPASRDIRLILKLKGIKIYEFNAMGVQDVKYTQEANGTEMLQIIINDQEDMRLVVKPGIVINHSYEEPT
jgi:hypothetical protein